MRCAQCGLEHPRSGFSNAQQRKAASRCKVCVAGPALPPTANVVPPLPPHAAIGMVAPITIDGATLEGGGQVLRCCMSLAWLVTRSMRVHSIRAGRPKPGLANQHLAGARLCATLSGLSMSGDQKGSTEVLVTPRAAEAPPVPMVLTADATTSGATTLMLQVALPPLLFVAAENTELVLLGGTDVPWSPITAHQTLVLAPLLTRMGASVDVVVKRRAFMPEVGELKIRGCLQEAWLRPLELIDQGAPCHVRGLVATSPGGANAGRALLACLEDRLRGAAWLRGCAPDWTTTANELPEQEEDQEAAAPEKGRATDAETAVAAASVEPSGKKARRPGQRSLLVSVSVQLAVHTDKGCILSANRLCSLPVETRDGLASGRADREAQATCAELEALLKSGACACEHTSDQLIVYMALAKGTSRLTVPPASSLSSQHLATAMHFAAHMTGATFRVSELGLGGCQLIECDGIGARRQGAGIAGSV